MRKTGSKRRPGHNRHFQESGIRASSNTAELLRAYRRNELLHFKILNAVPTIYDGGAAGITLDELAEQLFLDRTTLWRSLNLQTALNLIQAVPYKGYKGKQVLYSRTRVGNEVARDGLGALNLFGVVAIPYK